MDARKTSIIDVLFCCLVVNEAALTIIQPWLTGMIQSLLVYGIWAELIFIVAIIMFHNARNIDNRFIWLIGIIIVFLFSLLNGHGSMAKAVIGFLGFALTLLPYYWTMYIRHDDSHLKAIKVSTVVKGLSFVFTSMTANAYAPYYADGIAIRDGSLTLGYSNPNITGMLIMNTIGVLLSMIHDRDSQEGRIERWIVIALVVYLSYLSVLTQSRLTIICVALLLLMYLVRNLKITHSLLTRKWIIWFALILPLAFVYVFYYLYKNNPTLMFMGGKVYSRIMIYDVVLESVSKNKWVGDVITWYFQNTHNGLLSVLASLGIVGLIFYLIYMHSCLRRYSCLVQENAHSNTIPYLLLLLFSIHSCVEVAMVCGGVQFAAEVAIICMLCERNKLENDTDKRYEKMNHMPSSDCEYEE